MAYSSRLINPLSATMYSPRTGRIITGTADDSPRRMFTMPVSYASTVYTTVAPARQRHEAELLPAIGAVHRRRLVQLGRNVLEAGQECQPEKREALPGVRHDHRRQGRRGRAEQVQRVVDQPEISQGVVEHAL